MNTVILANIHRILVVLRAEIKTKESIELGRILVYALQNNLNNSEMITMISKQEFYKDICIKYGKGFLVIENKTEKISKEKYQQFSKILLLAIRDAICLMDNQEYELAYAIIDAFHVLPEIYVKNECVNLNEYWNIYVEPIKEKWNSESFYEVKRILERSL